MSPEQKNEFDILCTQIDKKYGKGTMQHLNDEVVIDPDNAIQTGSIALDTALGIGGYPKGRIIEIYGQESCLDKDTYISYELFEKGSDKSKNHKGGSIQKLYERFHNNFETGVKQGRHLRHTNVDFYVKSINDEHRVIRNKVLDVVKCGVKECFEVEESNGNMITCTEDHKFMTVDGFKSLKDIKLLDDDIYIHNNTKYSNRRKYSNRPEKLVKFHPHLPTKKVDKYIYHRGSLTTFIYEAFLNNMQLDEYINILNTKTVDEISKLLFVAKGMHIHHKDENFKNNSIDNLDVLDPKTHGYIHAKDRHNNLRFTAVSSKIISINCIGQRETYDIKCMYPYNNYIANKFVVHNSGKTTLCLQAVANAQASGQKCVYIDAEHALDIKYAKDIGCQIDKLTICQPDNGEQALEIVKMCAGSNQVGLIIVDSVAALVPQAELEGEIKDSNVAGQARMMSKAMRMITGTLNKTGCTVIFINQIRMKIGIMFGSPKTTTGGNALKFYASQRLEIIRTGNEKEQDKIVGNKTLVKVVKNKVAPPFKTAEFIIRFGKGVDKIDELIDLAVEDGVIEKAGAWYKYEGKPIAQGKIAAKAWLKENEEIKEKINKEIFELRGLI